MLLILLTISLVLLNGFFVAAEFAIVKVRHTQIEVLAKEGKGAARLSKKILAHLDGYLAATQLGITLASLGLGWIGEPVVSKLILKVMHAFNLSISPETAHDVALPLAFFIITVLHIVFGELAPKSLAIIYPKRTTLLAAYPLRIFYIVFRPFIWLLNGIANLFLRMLGIRSVQGADTHSSEELKYIVMQGKESGAIEEGDYHIIRNAFEFSERTVRQIMIPRMQVVGINVATSTEAALADIIKEGYSRMPCYEGSLDNIVGIVYLKDLLLKLRRGEAINLSNMLRPAIFIPPTRRIGSLLKEFQVKHQQMAVVVNEFGGMEGIVTMEDILEELVGEIQDESDEEIPPVEQTGDDTFSVIAHSTVHDINKYLPRPIEEHEEYETLAGILMGRFGNVPGAGEQIMLDGYECTIQKTARNTIAIVKLQLIEQPEEEEE
jgi:CBS domain containing-hemolysin-like protein